MAETLKTIKTRRSVKKYKSDPVPQEIIDKIVEAGLEAANGMAQQASIIIEVTNKEMRDRLSAMNAAVMGKEGVDPFYGAPVVLVVLAKKSVGTCVYDGSLTLGNMLLAAHDLGVGACWIHRAKQMFESEEGKAILKDLGIEEEYEGIGNCVVGYLDGDYPAEKPIKDGRHFVIK